MAKKGKRGSTKCSAACSSSGATGASSQAESLNTDIQPSVMDMGYIFAASSSGYQ